PYRRMHQSRLLYTDLAFGEPMVLSAAGGFTELVERHGAGRLVPPGDPAALGSALEELLGDERARRELADAAARAAAGPYSWDQAGEQPVAPYRDPLSWRLGLGRWKGLVVGA